MTTQIKDFKNLCATHVTDRAFSYVDITGNGPFKITPAPRRLFLRVLLGVLVGFDRRRP